MGNLLALRGGSCCLWIIQLELFFLIYLLFLGLLSDLRCFSVCRWQQVLSVFCFPHSGCVHIHRLQWPLHVFKPWPTDYAKWTCKYSEMMIWKLDLWLAFGSVLWVFFSFWEQIYFTCYSLRKFACLKQHNTVICVTEDSSTGCPPCHSKWQKK